MKINKKIFTLILASTLCLNNLNIVYANAISDTTIKQTQNQVNNQKEISITSLDDLHTYLKESIVNCKSITYSFDFETEIVFDTLEELNDFVEEEVNKAFNNVNCFYRQNILIRRYNTTYISTKYSNDIQKYKLSKIKIAYIFKNTTDDLYKVEHMLNAANPTIIKGAKNDYEKTKQIFRYVIAALDYKKESTSTDINDEENLKKLINERNLLKGITNKSGICETYAMLLYKLLEMNNIEAEIINGTYKNEKHVWVMVKLDDNWYHLDAIGSDYSVEDIKKVLKEKYPQLTQKLIEKNTNINYQNNFYKFFLATDKEFESYGYKWNTHSYPSATIEYKHPNYTKPNK